MSNNWSPDLQTWCDILTPLQSPLLCLSAPLTVRCFTNIMPPCSISTTSAVVSSTIWIPVIFLASTFSRCFDGLSWPHHILTLHLRPLLLQMLLRHIFTLHLHHMDSRRIHTLDLHSPLRGALIRHIHTLPPAYSYPPPQLTHSRGGDNSGGGENTFQTTQAPGRTKKRNE
jgi:hypothetical protein